MTTKIGIISDVHASPAPLREALELFEKESVDRIICAGDIAGYFDALDETIQLLRDYHCDCIIGNHDQTYMQKHEDLSDTDSYRFLQELPKTLRYEFDGKKILVVHAQPPDEQHGGIKLLDENNQLIETRLDFWRNELAGLEDDILIVGHTHQVFTEQLGDVLAINPGSTPFNHSCMILQLPDMTVDTFALESKKIQPTWNWGMQVRDM